MLTLKGWGYAGIAAVVAIVWAPFLIVDLLLIGLSMLFEWIAKKGEHVNEFFGGKTAKYFNKMKRCDFRTYDGWARAYQWKYRKELGSNKVRERPEDVPTKQKLTKEEFKARASGSWPGRIN